MARGFEEVWPTIAVQQEPGDVQRQRPPGGEQPHDGVGAEVTCRGKDGGADPGDPDECGHGRQRPEALAALQQPLDGEGQRDRCRRGGGLSHCTS